MALRLNWRHSFPGSRWDYRTNIEGLPLAFARVYYSVAYTTPETRWIWVAADEEGRLGEGAAADREAACNAAESFLLGSRNVDT